MTGVRVIDAVRGLNLRFHAATLHVAKATLNLIPVTIRVRSSLSC